MVQPNTTTPEELQRLGFDDLCKGLSPLNFCEFSSLMTLKRKTLKLMPYVLKYVKIRDCVQQ